MNKPIHLYESLFILYKCQLNINRIYNLTLENRTRNDSDENDAILLAQYLLMESLSFISEFKENLHKYSESEYKQRVADLHQITKPIFKRINKWKDIGRYRNNIIAHPWRSSGKFVIPNDPSYNIPKNWAEIFILTHLLKYVWAMITAEFGKEIIEAISYIDSTYSFKSNKEASYPDLNKDHLLMAKEVDIIRKRLNKSYYLKVQQYEFE